MYSIVKTCEWCNKEEKTQEGPWLSFKNIVPFFGRTLGNKTAGSAASSWDDSKFCNTSCAKAHEMATDCASAKAEDTKKEFFDSLRGNTVGNLRGVWMDLRGREWPLSVQEAKK